MRCHQFPLQVFVASLSVGILIGGAGCGPAPSNGLDGGDARVDAGTIALQACPGGNCVPYLACYEDGGCPALPFVADPPTQEPNTYLIGYADPSIRRSLDGATLYMAYSWTTTVPTVPKQTLNVETHLQQSGDNGATWSNTQTLFKTPGVEIIPGSMPADAGVSASEEISLVTAALDPIHPHVPYWVSVREKYYRPPGGGLDHDTYHLRIGLIQANSPAGLAAQEAQEQVMLNVANPAWFRNAMPANSVYLPDVFQNNVDGQQNCTYPVSPALYYQAPTLYLAFQCFVATNSVVESHLVVLKTNPYSASQGKVLPPTSWTWTYGGRFGDQYDAANMQTTVNGVLVPAFQPNMVFMPDFARGRDGTLLLIATPVIHDGHGDGRTGCQVFEMDSIDPPVLRHRGTQLVRRAIVDAPDLNATRYDFNNNVGSCGYEPTATGMGLLLARKFSNPTTLVTTSHLHDTGIHE